MNFLLITLEYFPFKGGIANYYTNLVYHWPKHSQLSVLNNNNNDLLRRKGFFRWTKSIKKIYYFIKKNNINHVIVGHILPLGISMYIVKRILGVKYSVVLHGMDFSFATRSKWKRFISKLILNRADKIICANSYVAKLCSNFLGSRDKIKVVNPGVRDFSDFSDSKTQEIKKKNQLEGHKILFSLGRLVKRKGFDNVILALQKFFSQNPSSDLIYIIAGRGPEAEYLKNLAFAKIGQDFEKRIKFVGEISESEKWSLLSLCDIFIMPSRDIAGDFEGFGIVYLEANLVEKPVIAGLSGGVSDAVENGVSGLLVNPENISEISEAIAKLLNNNELRIKLGEQGRRRALNHFNWKNQIENIYNFLNN